MLSGLLGGVGGAVVAQSISLNYSASTMVGQGFMAMAAMIFGRWNPMGTIARFEERPINLATNRTVRLDDYRACLLLW